jgi:hypothetical protein
MGGCKVQVQGINDGALSGGRLALRRAGPIATGPCSILGHFCIATPSPIWAGSVSLELELKMSIQPLVVRRLNNPAYRWGVNWLRHH